MVVFSPTKWIRMWKQSDVYTSLVRSRKINVYILIIIFKRLLESSNTALSDVLRHKHLSIYSHFHLSPRMLFSHHRKIIYLRKEKIFSKIRVIPEQSHHIRTKYTTRLTTVASEIFNLR